jgi:hypothetical protein
MTQAKESLAYFTHRNLLEVDAHFPDRTPATYRFQPTLRQEIVRRAQAAPPGMAAIRRPDAPQSYPDERTAQAAAQRARIRLADGAVEHIVAASDVHCAAVAHRGPYSRSYSLPV